MRIDPIYLLAPEKAPPEKTPERVSRRAVLGALAGGFLVGGTAARIFDGVGRHESGGLIVAPDDEGLLWALELQDDPLQTLIDQQHAFRIVFRQAADPRLMVGMERLVIAVLEDRPELKGARSGLARALARDIRSTRECEPLRRYLEELAKVD